MARVAPGDGQVNTRWSAVPDDLRDHPRWTLWRDEGGTKVPVDADGKKCDPHKHWVTFDEAVSLCTQPSRKATPKVADGIGLVLFDGCGLLAIDLDKVSAWEDEAFDILDSLSPYGYSEMSPSGNGYHIILRPRRVPASHRVKHRSFHGGRVEVYTKLRFLTVTGDDAEGRLEDMTRRGESKLHDFIAPLVDLAEEGMPPDPTKPSVEHEQTMSDSDVVFELIADSTKPTHPGAKAFRQIYEDEDAFDEAEDPSDLLASAVGALLRYTLNQSQVERLIESCAAAPHYVDRKTGKPKMRRWLKSELPKLIQREERSIEAEARVAEEAEDAGMFERYVWCPPKQAFYDLFFGAFVGKGGVDTEHKSVFTGQRGSPLLSTVLTTSASLVCVADQLWKPIPWREGDAPFTGPRGDRAVVHLGGVPYINTWRGFSVEPVEGDVTPWLDFIAEVVPDKRVHDDIIDRMAFDVQHPDRKCGWHLITVGVHGAGKDLMLMPLLRIFGPAVGKISDMAAKSGYEDEYVDTKIIHYEEASALKGSAYERLKTFATSSPDSVLYMNKKGQGKVPMHPLWSFYLTTNNQDAVKLESTERRWLVVNSRDTRLPDDVSRSFVRWLDRGGVSVVFDFLLNRDLTQFNPDRVEAEANALQEMVEASAEPWENALEAFFSSSAGVELMETGIINYHSLYLSIRREEGVNVRQIDVRTWLHKVLGWPQVRHIHTAKPNSKERIPTTYAAPVKSRLHHLRGKELTETILSLTGPGADFHDHAGGRG